MATHVPRNAQVRGAAAARSIDDDIVDLLTGDCIALVETVAADRVAREIANALAERRWADAVKWQRVKLRLKKIRLG